MRTRQFQTERTVGATFDSGPGDPQTTVIFRVHADGSVDLLVTFRPFPQVTFAAHDRSETTWFG